MTHALLCCTNVWTGMTNYFFVKTVTSLSPISYTAVMLESMQHPSQTFDYLLAWSDFKNNGLCSLPFACHTEIFNLF